MKVEKKLFLYRLLFYSIYYCTLMVDIYISTNLPVKIPPEHILCHVVELNLLIQGGSGVEPLGLVQPHLKIFCI